MTTEWRDPEDREGLAVFEDVLVALRLHSGGVAYAVGYWTGAYWKSNPMKEVIGWARFQKHWDDKRRRQ